MNPVVLQFANGNVFFLGLILVVIAAALYLRQPNRWLKLLLTICNLFGLCLVILSATPLPLWLYGLWLVPCLTGLIFYNVRSLSACANQCRRILFAAIAVSSAALFLIELPHHLPPVIKVSSQQPVFVVGDSITAGIGTGERSWPEVLGDLTHLQVTNLAQPGATAQSALKQAAHITVTNALVFIEIGGNDLLGGTTASTFNRDLDHLLGQLALGNHCLVMFEIPLVPFYNAYGETQRRLAAKYHATLIPKDYLTQIFALPGATLDGLHLSAKGHAALAKSIADAMQIK